MSNKKFFVGIKGIVIKDDKVLLIKASKKAEGRDHWEVPGGRIDDDETIEQALRRELNEEVPGIENVQVHEILNAFRVEHNVKDDVSLVLIFYRVSADLPDEITLSEEHIEHKWATLEEAKELDFPSVFEAIEMAFRI